MFALFVLVSYGWIEFRTEWNDDGWQPEKFDKTDQSEKVRPTHHQSMIRVRFQFVRMSKEYNAYINTCDVYLHFRTTCFHFMCLFHGIFLEK